MSKNIIDMKFDGENLTRLIKVKSIMDSTKEKPVTESDIRIDLKELLGITRQALSMWENGKCKPGLNKLIALRRFFKVANVESFLIGSSGSKKN